MNRLEERFKTLRLKKRKALIAYVTAGYSSLTATGQTARVLEEEGVDVIELGVPFSDPVADGPTIQYASQKALEKGISLSDILKWTKNFRKSSQIPLVLMSYMNPVHRMGYERFARAAADAGVDGLIVPDLIPEESAALGEAMASRGLCLIFLVAPTTPPERRKWVARKSRGFLYAVSVAGVTGARKLLPGDVVRFLKDLRKSSPVPVALGFGISSPAHIRAFGPYADGVIFGSALIDKLRKREPVRPFVKSLRTALDRLKK